MANHYATTESRIDELEIGFELLLPSGMDGVPPMNFVIDGISSSTIRALANHRRSG
jgi:hypothetical protein